jgi:shikimate 5-dehydrogenase
MGKKVIQKNNKNYSIIKKGNPTFYFIGVTTTKSSIMRLFPLWMEELKCPEIKIEGIDLKIHDNDEAYRKAVAQIKHDNNSIGALVTTHKMDLYNASKDMFEYFDPYAELLGEISCISKKDGSLEGHAKDPISSGLSFDSIIDENYFKKTGSEILIFGAGGSSIATILNLINNKNPADRPKKIIVVNRSKPRLKHLENIVLKTKTDISFDYIQNDNASYNDDLMSSLPDYSIVINATGMGKDTPGSPITDKGLFPKDGIAWEFNYRGELDFLYQAEKQEKTRNIKVEDGWIYFIHGWTQVIFQVLRKDMTLEIFDKLKIIADSIR